MSVSAAPRLGRLVADFCLPSSSGETVCLRDVLAEGPVLVWFYRGQWSSSCREDLADLRDRYGEFRRHGTTVVAVSPDALNESMHLEKELDLPFVLLSDQDRSVAETLGVAREQDLQPAAFLVDRRGRLRWLAIGRDRAQSPSVDSALAALTDRRLPVTAPSSVLTPVVAVLVVLAFTALGLLAAFANRSLLWWDEPLRDTIRGLDGDTFRALIDHVNDLGSRWVIAALSVPMVAIAWFRCRQLAVVLAVAFFAGLAIELVLKALVDRPRPPDGRGFGQSFPSGHVLAAVAFWGLLPPWAYVVIRRRWAWALAGAVAAVTLVGVGMSRVYLGAHWPSDVVGGYLGGAVFLLAAEWSVRQRWPALECDGCELHPLRQPAIPDRRAARRGPVAAR